VVTEDAKTEKPKGPPRRTIKKPFEWVRTAPGAARFGLDLDVAWVETPPNSLDRTLLTAAQTQHFIAVYVNNRIVRDVVPIAGDRPLQWLCEEALQTMGHDTLRRLLNGSTHMSLVHIQDLSGVFGPLLLLARRLGLREMGIREPLPLPDWRSRAEPIPLFSARVTAGQDDSLKLDVDI